MSNLIAQLAGPTLLKSGCNDLMLVCMDMLIAKCTACLLIAHNANGFDAQQRHTSDLDVNGLGSCSYTPNALFVLQTLFLASHRLLMCLQQGS